VRGSTRPTRRASVPRRRSCRRSSTNSLSRIMVVPASRVKS